MPTGKAHPTLKTQSAQYPGWLPETPQNTQRTELKQWRVIACITVTLLDSIRGLLFRPPL